MNTGGYRSAFIDNATFHMVKILVALMVLPTRCPVGYETHDAICSMYSRRKHLLVCGCYRHGDVLETSMTLAVCLGMMALGGAYSLLDWGKIPRNWSSPNVLVLCIYLHV